MKSVGRVCPTRSRPSDCCAVGCRSRGPRGATPSKWSSRHQHPRPWTRRETPGTWPGRPLSAGAAPLGPRDPTASKASPGVGDTPTTASMRTDPPPARVGQSMWYRAAALSCRILWRTSRGKLPRFLLMNSRGMRAELAGPGDMLVGCGKSVSYKTVSAPR